MALRVGLVGLRGIGLQHADAYKTDPLGDMVAVCDMVKERADSTAEKYGSRPYYSLKDMLENEPDLDIVDVSTGGPENGGWHYEPAMLAMEAGKHVLVEKPLSNDILQARDMVATAARKNLHLGCNLNHFFSPTADRARQYVDEGEIGELVFCKMQMGFNGGEVENYHASGGPQIEGFPYFHLKAFLSHPLSVMRYFCGDVTHVQAFCATPSFRKNAGDVMLTTASIHLKFGQGGAGYLLSQRGDANYGLGGWWSVEVGGTRGTFCIENCIERLTYWPAHHANEPVVMETGKTDFNETFGIRIHAFLEDVANGVPTRETRGSGRDALAVLEYTFAIIKSYENGGALVEPHTLPPLT